MVISRIETDSIGLTDINGSEEISHLNAIFNHFSMMKLFKKERTRKGKFILFSISLVLTA